MAVFNAGINALSEVLAEMIFESTEPVEVPVTIAGQKYVLKEMSEAVAIKLANQRMATAKLTADGEVVGFKSGEDDALTVSECLWKDGQLIPINAIRGWRTKIVTALANRVRQMSETDLPNQLKDVNTQLARLQKHKEKLIRDQAPGKDVPGDSTGS